MLFEKTFTGVITEVGHSPDAATVVTELPLCHVGDVQIAGQT